MPDTLVKTVGVAWALQEKTYYCGPATLEMVLRTFAVASPTTPPSWQHQLWELVKTNTGSLRPPQATDLPSFTTQKCEWCSAAGQWKCWNTSPDAMLALLNALQGSA